MTAIRADNCTADVASLWGRVDGGKGCAPDAATTRHRILAGAGPNGMNCREFWTEAGDDCYQMRSEAGRNEWRYGMNGGPGTFMLYAVGTCTRTSLWIRLGDDYPLADPKWSMVLQQKQAQPHGTPNPDIGPALTLGAHGGKFRLNAFWHELWSCPAETSRWLRVTWDVNHRNDASGWTQLTITRGGGIKWVSPRIDGATMQTEPIGTQPMLPKGAPCFSHLRMGPYHALNTQPRSVRYADIEVKAA